MQDELYGGARRRAPEGQTAKEKADELKGKIRNNDDDFLDPFMHQGYAQARSKAYGTMDAKLDKMLSAAKEGIKKWAQDEAGLDPSHAKAVAETVTRDQAYKWMIDHKEILAGERREEAERRQREEAERKEKEQREEAERDQRKKQEGGHRSKHKVGCQTKRGDH